MEECGQKQTRKKKKNNNNNNNIINFQEYIEENTPHAAGPVKCLICKYKFIVVTPVGELWFECPKCKVEKATWCFPIEKDKNHWKCNCGNWLFYITPEGIYCPNCGVHQKGF